MTQNLLDTINNTIQIHMNNFLKKIELSRTDLTSALDQLEKEVFNTLNSHYTDINEAYQENKDILNNFILMIFNEIRMTVEANFQIFKEQLKFTYEHATSQLQKSSQELNDTLKLLKTNFEGVLNKISSDFKQIFAQFKQQKNKTADLLIENILLMIEQNEMQIFSNIIKILDTFTQEFMKESAQINQEVQAQFEKSLLKFQSDLDSFNQKSQENFAKYLDSHKEKITAIKQKIEEILNQLPQDLQKIIASYKDMYLNILSSKIKEINQQIEKTNKNISDESENYKRDLNKLNENTQKIISSYHNEIISIENRLNKLLETTVEEGSKAEIKQILSIITKVKKENGDYQSGLQKSHQKNLQALEKDKNSLLELLQQIPNRLEDEFPTIQQSLGKELSNLQQNTSTNLEKLRSKTDLFGNLDNQIKEFHAVIEKIITDFSKMKKTYDKTLTNSLNELTSLIKSVFSTVDKRIKDDMVAFYKNYEIYMKITIEEMQQTATEILKESPNLTPLTFPELDEAFKTLTSLFETYLRESQEKYQKTIQENRRSLYPSIDSFKTSMDESISQFSMNQNKLVLENQTINQKLMTILNDTFQAQFTEFQDRLDQDLNSLLNANQELIGKIMIKSAKTGSEFFEKSEKTSKESEEVIADFMNRFNVLIRESQPIFNEVIEKIRTELLNKISQ